MDPKVTRIIGNKFVCGAKSLDIISGMDFEKNPLKYAIQLRPEKYTEASTENPKFYFAVDTAMCVCLVPIEEEIQTETEASLTDDSLETYESNTFIQTLYPIRVYKQTQTIGGKPCTRNGSSGGLTGGLTGESVITELIIPPNTTIFFGENGKCRSNKAFVVKNTMCHTDHPIQTAYSLFEDTFFYEEGQNVYPGHFSISFKTCGSGIHFYCEKDEAKNFKMIVRI